MNSWKCLIDDISIPTSKTNQTNPNPVPVKNTATASTTQTTITPEVILTPKPTKVLQRQAKTFAQAVSNICDVPTSQLPQPVLKGENFSISIPEEEYLTGLGDCKFNLHARVIWPKGSTPLSTFDLRAKLSTLWKDLSKWGISFIGKGFYSLTFSCLEDVKRVRSIASWNLNPGVMKFFTWTKDFDPNLQNSTSAQVWVRIYGLPQEYWRPRILFAIARCAGTPICTDSASAKPMIERTFGHYARVLVDMDVTQTLRYKVLVERVGYAFFVELDYENIPDFCSHCKKIGHHIGICKLKKSSEFKGNEEPKTGNLNVNGKETWKKKQEVQKQGKHVNEHIDVDEAKEAAVNAEKQKTGNNQVTGKAGPSGTKDNMAGRQNNTFEALLSIEANEDEIRDAMSSADMELEHQGNKEFVKLKKGPNENDDRSQGSEFVDATQQVARNEASDASVDHEVSEEEDSSDDISEEEHNQNFLNKPWANIAEDVESENRLLKHLKNEGTANNDIPDEGFKVVQKRKPASKKVLSKNSLYNTRANSGNPKPFK